jgi:hypothetical protein
VAVVQYIFTHKQYTERYKTNNTQNNTTILEECGPCPVLASYTLAFALQLRKKFLNSLLERLVTACLNAADFTSIMELYFHEDTL